MARFDHAIAVVLSHEGGFVDDPVDRGGATNWGISTRFLRRIGDTRDVRDLTHEDAVELYRRHFWQPGRFQELQDQDVATKAFDLAVNMGQPGSVRLLQRACRACGLTLKEDGVIGPKTLAAANSGPWLLPSLRSEAAGHYRFIVARRPEQRRFLNGWLRRAYS